jgi:iron(III) transport system substrate-binding protein
MKFSTPHIASALALAAALLAAPLAMAQAPAPAPTPVAPPDGILIYNAQHAGLTKEWAEGFTRETGIKVVIRQGSDTEIGNLIVQEGANSPADVFLTENSPAQVLVDNAGLFAALPADIVNQVPAEYRPASGKWIGIAARTTVFAYNKDMLKPEQLPKSMLDLARPEWKGRWAGSPSGADFQAIVGALLQLKGEEATAAWLKAMKENATLIRGNSTAMKAANAGEIPGALIYHYYYFGDQAKTGEISNKIGMHYFRNQDPGAFVSISGGGVLASSKKQAQAQAFLKWVTGKGGQDILRNGDSFEYAVVGASNPKLEPLDKLQAPKVDASKLDSKKVIELMTRANLL